jgi:hypothetical protein
VVGAAEVCKLELAAVYKPEAVAASKQALEPSVLELVYA